VIGWWTVATTGEAGALQQQQAVAQRLVVVDDVGPGLGRGRAAALAARRLKVSGSGKAAVHISRNSRTSVGDRNSRQCGTRNGSGSR
jgi:hypothetical protein